MSKSSKEEAKMMYELAKIANTTRQLSDDFQQSVVLFLFKNYIDTLKVPESFLMDFMDQWEEHVLQQKVDELDALTTQSGSMIDMVAGVGIASAENVEEFKNEVKELKQLFMYSLLGE